jgi:hypothetical protein
MIFLSFSKNYNQKFQSKPYGKNLFCELCSKLHDKQFMNNNEKRRWKISKWFNPVKECWDSEYPIGLFEKLAKFFGYCV